MLLMEAFTSQAALPGLSQLLEAGVLVQQGGLFVLLTVDMTASYWLPGPAKSASWVQSQELHC